MGQFFVDSINQVRFPLNELDLAQLELLTLKQVLVIYLILSHLVSTSEDHSTHLVEVLIELLLAHFFQEGSSLGEEAH